MGILSNSGEQRGREEEGEEEGRGGGISPPAHTPTAEEMERDAELH